MFTVNSNSIFEPSTFTPVYNPTFPYSAYFFFSLLRRWFTLVLSSTIQCTQIWPHFPIPHYW